VKSLVAREHVEFTALDGIDLAIGSGEFVGLIGPNGAGKTTLVKTLVGIIPVSSGAARLFGADSFHLGDEHKRRLSLVMGQRSQLWWDIPAIDSFKLLAEIYGVERADFERRVAEMSQRLDVAERLSIQLRHLSLGQRMKMEIIGAFLHAPDVVFLDEPTIGLDLVSRDVIRQFLVDVNRERRATVILTSHDVEDIERTCRRLVILDGGRVLYDGDLVSLQRRIVGRRAVQVHLEPSAPSAGIQALSLTAFDAELVEESALALTFVIPAEKSQAFLRHLFERLPVRDVNIERQAAREPDQGDLPPHSHRPRGGRARRGGRAMSAVLPARHSGFARALALVWTSVEYEFRKVSAFRAGFVMREVLRGVTRPIVMIFVLQAVYAGRGGAPINGLTLTAATQYMILLAVLEKLVFHERVLDLAEQIFQGYVTKFLVMPFPFFVLPLGRFVQYTLTQIVVATVLWTLGALVAPDVWPMPASVGAALMSFSLTLSASFCFCCSTSSSTRSPSGSISCGRCS
jgi:ABC-2 type transport system ATP-binding protein